MLFRRVIFPSVLSIRTYASSTTSKMAVPPQSFKLDRAIFNQTLYSDVRSTWFKDVPSETTSANMTMLSRWYGMGSAEDRAAFDQECKNVGGAALDSIGPSRLALPTFESHDKDVKNSEEIAAPFLAEIVEAQKEGEKAGAEMLLSLALLLDQFPRNIYRDLAGLKLLYSHYDRLSLALFYSSLRLSPSPVEYEGFRLKPVFKNWLFMPLMHSEHLPSHELYVKKVNDCLKDLEAVGDEAAAEDVKRSLSFEDKHIDPLKKFGRFPHRNECMGRESTPAEEEHLKDGSNSFGVKQNQKEGEKDEL